MLELCCDTAVNFSLLTLENDVLRSPFCSASLHLILFMFHCVRIKVKRKTKSTAFAIFFFKSVKAYQGKISIALHIWVKLKNVWEQ